MTIFRTVVQAFLIEGIDKIKTTSMDYDQGILNYARTLTMFGGRDLALSQDKRTRLDRLRTEIEALPEKTDRETKQDLLELITRCNHDLLGMCTAKKRPTGSSEIALTDLSTFVTAASEKICDYFNLSDVPTDTKTINKLKYYAAKAGARSVYEAEYVKLSETWVLNEAKEKIILDALDFAVQISKTTNTAKASNPQSVMPKEYYIQLMVERAEFIQREVQKIDAAASNDYVIEYMREAIESFMPPAPTQAPQVDEASKEMDPQLTV